MRLSQEAISLDRHDPGSYHRMINALMKLREYDIAMNAAESLLRLFEPKMHPRTRYCLEQNPQIRKALRSGKYDPAAEARQIIARVRAASQRRA